MELAAHDLVSFKSTERLLSDKPLPDWVLETLKEVFFGVVRRDSNVDKNLVPIGIRGKERGQRFGTWIDIKDITDVITPMSLTNPQSWKKKYDDTLPEAVKTLEKIAPVLNRLNLKWGPTGSVAYELATGYNAVKITSDLDLVIDTPEKLSLKLAQNILDEIQKNAGCRLDVQLETPRGGISLLEYIQSDLVLTKTNRGPFLCDGGILWDKINN